MAEVTLTSTPDNERVGSHPISARVKTFERTDGSGNVADVRVSVTLLIDGQKKSSADFEGVSGDTFNPSFEYNFAPPKRYGITINADIDYGGTNAQSFGSDIQQRRDTEVIDIIEREPNQQAGQTQNQTYVNAYQNRGETVLEEITTDEDTILNFDNIFFSPFDNPSVSVDSSARFAVHEIIGGTTVRQKIGEDPREIEISGVCDEETAQQVNQLNKAKLCSLNSETVGDVVRCQIASTSTDPLEDGGAADMDKGTFLYSFNINLVEIGVMA